MSNQKDLGDLLDALTRMVKTMPADQFDKLIKGGSSSLSSPKKRAAKAKGSPPPLSSPKKKTRRATSLIPIQPLSELNKDDLLSKLLAAPTPDAGVRILEDAFSRKEELLEFAKFLDIPVQKKDKSDRIRDEIVAFTISRRLDSEAIRGGYTAK